MRQILVLFLAVGVYYLVAWVLPVWLRMRRRLRQQTGGERVEELVQDPSCHTYLPKSQALHRFHGGTGYYFCSQECWEQFRRQPRV